MEEGLRSGFLIIFVVVYDRVVRWFIFFIRFVRRFGKFDSLVRCWYFGFNIVFEVRGFSFGL